MWPDLALFSANDMHIKILLEHTETAIIKKKFNKKIYNGLWVINLSFSDNIMFQRGLRNIYNTTFVLSSFYLF